MTKVDPTAKVHAPVELTSLERRADRLMAENSFPFQSFRIWFLEDRTFVGYNSKTICFGDDCDLLSSNINSVSSKMTLLVSCWVKTDFRDLFGTVILHMITRCRVSSMGVIQEAPWNAFCFTPNLLKTCGSFFIWDLIHDLSYNDFTINSIFCFM